MQSVNSKRDNGTRDLWIFVPVCILSLLGVVIVFSSTTYLAENRGLSLGAYHFFVKHMLRLSIAIFLFLLLYTIPKEYLRKIAFPLFGITLFLLVIVLLIGKFSHGAKRWINLFFGLALQPSEVMKLSLILFLAEFLHRIKDRIHNFLKGYLPSLLIISSVSAIILIQPNVSSAFLLFVLGCSIVFFAGAKIRHILLTGVLAGVALVYSINHYPHAMERWKKFTSIEENYQLNQGIIGIAEGRVFGAGIGRGKGKLLYLPEVHTDFIFSVIGEETGFMGASLVVLLFLILSLRGFRIARNYENIPFYSILAFGISFMIILYAFTHIAVVLGLLPTTGIPLPFISYGGSSLIVNLGSAGILLNLAGGLKRKPLLRK